MATAREPQQPEQQQAQQQPAIEAELAEAPAAPAAAVSPGEPVGSSKSFLTLQREALNANVARRGKRIVCTQAMALVTTTILGMLCWFAFTQTDSNCSGGPVGLRSWYLGAFVLECILFMCFFSVMYSVLSVWSRQAVGDCSAAPAEQRERVHGSESSCAICLGFALTLLAFFVVIWSTVGLLAKRDEGSCSSGGGYFWYIYTVMWVSICCCTGSSTADTYRRQQVAQTPEASQEQEITV